MAQCDELACASEEFDNHGPERPEGYRAIYRDLRDHCPVAQSEAHGGFWFISGHDAVQKVARDDATYSSENDLELGRGIAMPGMPATSTPGVRVAANGESR